MTGALVIYSATFMRYALAVSPKNYLLFACHAINFSAQCTQGYRYLNYWKYVAPDSCPVLPSIRWGTRFLGG
jgi:small nuclear ribonucleoprotein B and B'